MRDGSNPEAAPSGFAAVTVMRIWWVVRGARDLYEIPRGLDDRLVERRNNWQVQAQQLFIRCVAEAEIERA